MTAPNGHAGSSSSPHVNGADNVLASQPLSSASRLTDDRIRQIIGDLEAPFDPSVIEWRVTNTAKDKRRGQVIPYANQRAYTDRLNALVTPAGWTRKYTVHTSANFQRGKDQTLVAKILVTCELTIFGLGSHSATGEEWADDDNAGTSAEAQSFKRACSCLGLGRYLYYFTGEWVDLDERKRPKGMPRLPTWATPEGWRQGLRPQQETGNPFKPGSAQNNSGSSQNLETGHGDAAALVRQIEALEDPLGKGIYRGLLKAVARVWNPIQIRDVIVLSKVLEHMQGAQRGMRRLAAAIDATGPEALAPILQSLKLSSLEKVDNLETLKQIVLQLEQAAAKVKR